MCTLWLPEGAVHGAPLVAGPTSVAGSPVVMVLVAVRWSIWCWVPLVATGRWCCTARLWSLVQHPSLIAVVAVLTSIAVSISFGIPLYATVYR